MEIVVSKSPEKDIHDRIGTIEHNTFGSSRGDKREEKKASKVQEGREISNSS